MEVVYFYWGLCYRADWGPLYYSHIQAEHRDCVERAQRLAVAKEALSSGSDFAAQSVKMEDLLIYLRHLICQHHSVRKVNQYLRVSHH